MKTIITVLCVLLLVGCQSKEDIPKDICAELFGDYHRTSTRHCNYDPYNGTAQITVLCLQNNVSKNESIQKENWREDHGDNWECSSNEFPKGVR